MELKIAQPLTLKCGLTLPNRLGKASMAELFAAKHKLPASKKCLASYGAWAQGGWGLVLSGHVQVDPRYLASPGDAAYDPSIPREQTLAAWRRWAEVSSANGTKAIVQINHPGRQSPPGAGDRSIFSKTLAPSPVPLDFGSGLVARALSYFIFGTPQEMSVDDIHDVAHKWAETAKVAAEAGFAGCEIHAAHGYLLAQFLSPKTNRRTDAYGGSAAARVKIVVEVIQAVRAAVPSGFCVGIKLNSVDHQNSADLRDCIEQLHAITEAGIDFLEISGGTYENPVVSCESPPSSHMSLFLLCVSY
jgi:2,4-dienoyl-CoA reductase-like NADH-dependent reductase (Old Yellow Enzyme family)